MVEGRCACEWGHSERSEGLGEFLSTVMFDTVRAEFVEYSECGKVYASLKSFAELRCGCWVECGVW